MTGPVYLREVDENDLEEFFAHQQDPVANQMAAFPARDREAFMAHWRKIVADEQVVIRTILLETEVAGNVLCFEQSGKRLIGYWLGRQFWGRSIASRAVSSFVSQISARPLHAYVAKGNIASIGVLEKCGFRVSAEHAATGDDAVDEWIYSLSE